VSLTGSVGARDVDLLLPLTNGFAGAAPAVRIGLRYKGATPPLIVEYDDVTVHR
jgi:hypothetical protein